jgi:protein-S-isoprenylcysteine O-methyltransferase Ste14
MNNEITTVLVPLGAGFVIYFTLHSFLASLTLKKMIARHWPGFMPAYRLSYNILAVVLFLPLLWLMQQNQGPLLWEWHGIWSNLANGLALVALISFFWSLKSYDNGVFLGLTQLKNRNQDTDDPGQFCISTQHRFVRHPWYCFGLVILWTRDIHLSQLVSYGLMSLYLVIGSRLEERKLIELYGEAYKQYCERVPGLLPLPWRWITQSEADELMRMANSKS